MPRETTKTEELAISLNKHVTASKNVDFSVRERALVNIHTRKEGVQA